jgi:hypothetical protein
MSKVKHSAINALLNLEQLEQPGPQRCRWQQIHLHLLWCPVGLRSREQDESILLCIHQQQGCRGPLLGVATASIMIAPDKL